MQKNVISLQTYLSGLLIANHGNLTETVLSKTENVSTRITEKSRVRAGVGDAGDVAGSSLWPSLSSACLWLHSGQASSRHSEMAAHSSGYHLPNNPGNRSPAKVPSLTLAGNFGSSAHSQTRPRNRLVRMGSLAEAWASCLPWS